MKFLGVFLLLISTFSISAATAQEATTLGTGSYYDWGRGQDGWGYCYEWTYDGQPLNGGRPVNSGYCESRSPSLFNCGRGHDGWGHCYQQTPKGEYMNQGRPVSDYQCEERSPSYYSWGRGADGNTYCYRYANGLALNNGRPVDNNYCR